MAIKLTKTYTTTKGVMLHVFFQGDKIAIHGDVHTGVNGTSVLNVKEILLVNIPSAVDVKRYNT